ncbi:response regulator transcription factor [Saccharothrix isguenensis]
MTELTAPADHPVRARHPSDARAAAVTVADRHHGHLSPRQREVLEMVPAGMTSAAIAEALVLSPETVRTHVEAVLRRLGPNGRAHAVPLAYRKGLLSRIPTTA